MAWTIVREHSICAGHRVYGHEGKCKNLHGHEYKWELVIESPRLDDLGRVVDFSVVKNILCEWLEDNWDHKMLLYQIDPMCAVLRDSRLEETFVELPVNPTAENLAMYFVRDVAPRLLEQLMGPELVEVRLWETSKCSAIYRRNDAKNYQGTSGTVTRKDVQEVP